MKEEINSNFIELKHIKGKDNILANVINRQIVSIIKMYNDKIFRILEEIYNENYLVNFRNKNKDQKEK